MSPEPVISVGIITDGNPVTSPATDGTHVHNLLIGDGFHWQKRVKATFKGELIPLAKPQGNIHMVNKLPVEQYLQSVIGSEMNPNAPSEFLKAHAIISRSWAIRKMSDKLRANVSAGKVKDAGRIIEWEESDSHIGFDVCSDDHCQRYQGIRGVKDEKTMTAVTETRGLILTTNSGEIADTRFSKCCGGMTEEFSACWSDIDHDYLQSRQDPWCDLSDMTEDARDSFLSSVLKGYDNVSIDFYTWEAEVSPTETANRIRDNFGVNIGKILHLKPIKRGKSGRITELQIEGSEGSISIGKTLPIRRLLASDCLKSSWFDVEERSGNFKLHGHGWGHGVGLCQIGAARMSEEGYDFRDILEFYYPGTKLTKQYE